LTNLTSTNQPVTPNPESTIHQSLTFTKTEPKTSPPNLKLSKHFQTRATFANHTAVSQIQTTAANSKPPNLQNS
jgi:hypothetical protein